MTGLFRATLPVVFGLAVALPASPESVSAQTVNADVTAGALSDASVAGTFDALNQWDIDTGAMVADQGNRKDIRAFAAQITRDHHAIQKLDRDVVKKLKLQLVLPKGLAIQQNHEAGMMRLKNLEGKDFDRVFLPTLVLELMARLPQNTLSTQSL